MNSEKVLSFFKDITRVPRESGHEGPMIEYLKNFAIGHNLEYRVDGVGNVLIIKEASVGYENRPTVVLQSHIDMVCEKVEGSVFDFTKDAIKYEEEDGWLVARETTLGADDGIGVASELVFLADDSLKHPRLECLFTISEETGLEGALALEKGFISGKNLINLDNEDEGQLCLGCAGGKDTVATFKYNEEVIPSGYLFLRFSIDGGLGGHSGGDIEKHRMNAVRQMARFLNLCDSAQYRLCCIEGGTKRNAIARSARAVVALSPAYREKMVSAFSAFGENLSAEFASTDPDVSLSVEPVAWDGGSIDCDASGRIVSALVALPHGVMVMSPDIEGLVQTSTNLATVRTDSKERIVTVGTMQRSAVASELTFIGDIVRTVCNLAGASCECSAGYPGWKPNMSSSLKNLCCETYSRVFNKSMEVVACHGGLECGLFTEKFPDMDMVSFGPTLVGVHAPGEKLDLASLDRYWAFLVELLASM